MTAATLPAERAMTVEEVVAVVAGFSFIGEIENGAAAGLGRWWCPALAGEGALRRAVSDLLWAHRAEGSRAFAARALRDLPGLEFSASEADRDMVRWVRARVASLLPAGEL